MGYDDVLLRDGAKPGSHSVWYFKNGQLIAVDSVNDARSYAVGRQILTRGLSISRQDVEGVTNDVKELLARSS
jgi:3-phenylpropionate/trans-cinnamate dioxygenase ferredoxin reductase subunit